MPLVYARNRLRSATASALQSLARRSNALPTYEVAEPQHPHARSQWWDDASTSSTAAVIAHPELEGLYLWRNAVDASGIAALRALVDAVVEPAIDRGLHTQAERAEREAAILLDKLGSIEPNTELAIESAEAAAVAVARRDVLRAAAATAPPPPPLRRSSTGWEWFDYEPSRGMAPMLAHPDEGGGGLPLEMASRHLSDFEVFGSAKVEEWLSLEQLSKQNNNRHDAVAVGSARLRQLQSDWAAALPCVRRLDGGPICMFHQLQWLERGSCIEAHVDAPTPPADVVATLALSGSASSTVRVGHVSFHVAPGDAYAISGAARWEVSHEVHASTQDRLSLTVRYAAAEGLGL